MKQAMVVREYTVISNYTMLYVLPGPGVLHMLGKHCWMFNPSNGIQYARLSPTCSYNFKLIFR